MVDLTKRIGLIGGLALRAGVFYYEQLVQKFGELDVTLDLVLRHADVKRVLAAVGSNDKAALGTYLGSLANDLFASGTDLVAITAVAPHLAIEELVAESRGPVVNVLESVLPGLRAAGLKRVAIFGNRAVMLTNMFGAIPDEMVVRLDPSRLELVHATYNDVALFGKRGTAREADLLHQVAREAMMSDGAEAVVLAGTDLSSFYAEEKPAFRSVDVAQLHIDRIVALALAP